MKKGFILGFLLIISLCLVMLPISVAQSTQIQEISSQSFVSSDNSQDACAGLKWCGNEFYSNQNCALTKVEFDAYTYSGSSEQEFRVYNSEKSQIIGNGLCKIDNESGGNFDSCIINNEVYLENGKKYFFAIKGDFGSGGGFECGSDLDETTNSYFSDYATNSYSWAKGSAYPCDHHYKIYCSSSSQNIDSTSSTTTTCADSNAVITSGLEKSKIKSCEMATDGEPKGTAHISDYEVINNPEFSIKSVIIKLSEQTPQEFIEESNLRLAQAGWEIRLDNNEGNQVYVLNSLDQHSIVVEWGSSESIISITTNSDNYESDFSLVEAFSEIVDAYLVKYPSDIGIEIIEPTEETGPVEIPTEWTDKSSDEQKAVCNGCLLESNCYPFGYRQSKKYCSGNKEFVQQLSSDSACDNNFECEGNICAGGKCVSMNLIQKIIAWLTHLFGG